MPPKLPCFLLSEILSRHLNYFFHVWDRRVKWRGSLERSGCCCGLTAYWQPTWRQDTPVTHTPLPADAIDLPAPAPSALPTWLWIHPSLHPQRATPAGRHPSLLRGQGKTQSRWRLGRGVAGVCLSHGWTLHFWLHAHPSRHKMEEQTSIFGEHFLRSSACLHQSYQRDRETPKAFRYYKKSCPMYVRDWISGIEFSGHWAAEGGHSREHSRRVWSFTSMCSRDFRVWNGFECIMFYFFKSIIIVM